MFSDPSYKYDGHFVSFVVSQSPQKLGVFSDEQIQTQHLDLFTAIGRNPLKNSGCFLTEEDIMFREIVDIFVCRNPLKNSGCFLTNDTKDLFIDTYYVAIPSKTRGVF